MKATSFIIFFAIGLFFSCSENEKINLKNFGNAVTNDNVKLEKVIDEYIPCDEKAKKITLLQLQMCRDEYKKKPSKITVYSYNEALAKGKGYKIESNEQDYVFFIYFNKDFIMPVLLNSNSKIISFSAMNKGGISFFIKINGDKK